MEPDRKKERFTKNGKTDTKNQKQNQTQKTRTDSQEPGSQRSIQRHREGNERQTDGADYEGATETKVSTAKSIRESESDDRRAARPMLQDCIRAQGGPRTNLPRGRQTSATAKLPGGIYILRTKFALCVEAERRQPSKYMLTQEITAT